MCSRPDVSVLRRLHHQEERTLSEALGGYESCLNQHMSGLVALFRQVTGRRAVREQAVLAGHDLGRRGGRGCSGHSCTRLLWAGAELPPQPV